MINIIKYSYFILTKILASIISGIILLYVGYLYIRKYFVKEPEQIANFNNSIDGYISLSKKIFTSKNKNDVIDEL